MTSTPPALRSPRPAGNVGVAADPEPRIDGARVLRTVEELAWFGADERGGVSRLGFSPADDEARRYLADAAREAGLVPTVDPAGNLIVRRSGARTDVPALLMGSHLDSVSNGGRLDGAYGVAAAWEVLRVLAAHDTPMRYEPVAIALANEEGSLFPYPFWGSLAVIGQLDHPKDATDVNGVSLRRPLRDTGGDLDRTAEAAWPPGSIGAYLELHIEQGPVLERAGVTIGVVDAVVGRTIFDLVVSGRQNHAGTTPMDGRADALTAAARLVLAVESVARDRKLCAVATVGVLTVEPGVTNAVPGLVRMSAEIRDNRADRLATAEAAVLAEVARIDSAGEADATVRAVTRFGPVPTDPALRDVITAAARELGLSHRTMPSGAGHDAQIIAAIAPIGMIFVPSRGGVSHAPDEDSDDAHLIAGAEVLLRAALRL